MNPLEKPAAQILQVQWKHPANIDAVMTLREGGVSSGPFGAAGGVGGMNVGKLTGDIAFCVDMNRRLAASLAPKDPLWLTQVHKPIVVDAETAQPLCEADAAVAATPGTVLCVQVADCLPVLLADSEGSALAVVHCSWRTLAAGILPLALKRLLQRGKGQGAVTAWLGPRISARHYETDGDVPEALLAAFPGAGPFCVPEANGKHHVDLAGVAKAWLCELGVRPGDIADCGLCTFSDPARFYSYRRDKKTGRHAVLAWIKETP